MIGGHSALGGSRMNMGLTENGRVGAAVCKEGGNSAKSLL